MNNINVVCFITLLIGAVAVSAAPVTPSQQQQCEVDARSVRNIQFRRGQTGFENFNNTVKSYEKILTDLAKQNNYSAERLDQTIHWMYQLTSWTFYHPQSASPQDLYQQRLTLCVRWAEIHNSK